jgi:ATP-binding cassette subfamily B protein
MVGEVSMEVLLPYLMAMLIDNGIDKGDMNYILNMGLRLFAAAMLAMCFGILSGAFAASASAGFARNVRKDLFYSVSGFSFSNIDKFSASSLVTRLTTDVANVQNAYQMIIRMAVRAPMMLLMSFAMAFSVSRKLSMTFLLALPILGFGLWYVITSTHPIFVRVFKTYDKLNRVVRENLRGMRVVKSFVREGFEREKFGVISDIIFKDFSKAEKRLAINMPLMQLCAYGCLIMLMWFGARMIIVDKELATGELMSLIAYSMQILSSLMMLSMVFVMIIISRASAERITEVLNETSSLRNPDAPVFKVKDGSISLKGVNFSYAGKGGKICLAGANLDIASGETVGILGGTGSSKTTLVQLIPRLYDATGGEVIVGGVNVRNYDIESLRNAVSVVLQKNVLFSGTIKENLLWGNENATNEEIARACSLAQADGFIDALPGKYGYFVEQGGSNVSGGQKQRLCIARALLKNPKILILDDSTSAVDTRTDAAIRKAFKEDLPKVTKIIISQRAASVQDADKIVIMESGRIEAVGTHETLMRTSQIYREVYESQTRGGDFDEASQA